MVDVQILVYMLYKYACKVAGTSRYTILLYNIHLKRVSFPMCMYTNKNELCLMLLLKEYCTALRGWLVASHDVSCTALRGWLVASHDVSCTTLRGWLVASHDVSCTVLRGWLVASHDVSA